MNAAKIAAVISEMKIKREIYRCRAVRVCTILYFLIFSSSVSAQTDTSVGPQSLENARREVIEGNGDNAAIDRDGRDPNLGAYERSPILFDPFSTDERVRVYPQLTDQTSYTRNSLYAGTVCSSRFSDLYPAELRDICNNNGQTSESPGTALVFQKQTSTLTMTNLMVDDEIHKSEMAIFKDPDALRENFLADENQAQRYLQDLTTARSIMDQALSFLDRTIASSAANVRSQSDMSMMQQLLRQINLNTSQIANPERVQIYKDWNEKFEACMWSKGDESELRGATGQGVQPMFSHVNFDLPNNGGHCFSSSSPCRTLFGATSGLPSTQGLYQFCSCCADRVLRMNDSTVDQVEDSNGLVTGAYRTGLCEEYLIRQNRAGVSTDAQGGGDLSRFLYSMVERTFVGLDYTSPNTPAGANGWNDPQELRAIVNNYAHFFQDIYGDVCVYETTGGFIRKKFIPGFWSVPQLVDLMRNGKPDEICERATQYCPITAEQVTVGICPAFKLLVALESRGELHRAMVGEAGAVATREEIESYWIQASLGDTLSARDLQNVVKNFSKHPEFNRYIETFCDASAAAAVKKLHTRMMSIALDHMLLNQKLSDEDRKVVRRVMDRLSDYLNLAAQDSASMASSMIIASEVQRNRLDQADRGSFVASALGSSRNNAQMDELDAPFGGAAPTSALIAGNP